MRHDPDRGSATVWAAGAMALVWLTASVAFAHGAAVTGRHRAETAADLAALAAAVHVLTGDACTVAAEVAGRNGGVLSGCRIAGEDVEVEVRRPVRVAGAGVHTAVARSRAGPVDRGGPVP